MPLAAASRNTLTKFLINHLGYDFKVSPEEYQTCFLQVPICD